MSQSNQYRQSSHLTPNNVNGATAINHLFPHSSGASWSNVASQLKTLIKSSPLITVGVVLAATAGLVYSYRVGQVRRRQEHERRVVMRYVKRDFTHRRLEILRYIYEAPWNHFDLRRVEVIFASFQALLTDKRRGVLPLSDIVQLYKAGGVNDELVALACARFWDVDGNAQVDFLELMERLNLVFFGTKQQQLRAFFRVFDLDGSKGITRGEMEEVLSAMSSIPHGSSLGSPRGHSAATHSHEVVQAIFRKADTNQDGIINMDEFLNLAEVEGLNFSFNKDFVKSFGLEWGEEVKRTQ